MSKAWIAILLAVAALFVLSVVAESRIAAGGGALLLLAGLIYGYVHNKRASDATTARAERGAVELREKLEEEDQRRDS